MNYDPTSKLKPLWKETPDLALVAELCEKWNSSKLYEIFWEYAQLDARVLREKKARSWLCYENGRISGFALARKIKEIFIVEELWEEFDGLFGDIIEMSKRDLQKVEAFRSQILEKIEERPMLIRGAIDNCFAHGVARALGLSWFNGLILATRTLSERIHPVVIPQGYALRDFGHGDEKFFSSLYREVYLEKSSSGGIRKMGDEETV